MAISKGYHTCRLDIFKMEWLVAIKCEKVAWIFPTATNIWLSHPWLLLD